MLVSRGGRRRFLWTRQVDAAAGVGEDEEIRAGGGGARATAQWREEEEDGGDEWLRGSWAGLFIR